MLMNQYKLFVVMLLIALADTGFAQTLIFKDKKGHCKQYRASEGKELNISINKYDSLRNAALHRPLYNGNQYEISSKGCHLLFLPDKILSIQYCGISALKDTSVLWDFLTNIDCITDCRKLPQDKANLYIPNYNLFDVTRDNKWALIEDLNSPVFTPRSCVIEIDLNSGNRIIYGPLACKPCYAPNEQYILANNLKKSTAYLLFQHGNPKKIKSFHRIKEIMWLEN
jgi:hypothetical protein